MFLHKNGKFQVPTRTCNIIITIWKSHIYYELSYLMDSGSNGTDKQYIVTLTAVFWNEIQIHDQQIGR